MENQTNANEELISKKALLEKYAISYGALYRWKRKGLIPEEWFIKKATVTGQETFFPRELICQRVELILNRKEEVLLDELSRKLQSSTPEALVISTRYGEKKLLISDIHRITLSRKDGSSVEITDKIFDMLKEKNNEC
ncbi:MAG: DUF4004 family protein [Faecousia sp.]